MCAHRYTVRDVLEYNKQPLDTKRGVLGMCYILDSNLTLTKDTNVGKFVFFYIFFSAYKKGINLKTFG